MLAFLVPILMTIYVYRQAKENGRNALLWAAICLAIGLGGQLLLGLTAGIAIGIGIEFYGWDANLLDVWALPISLVSMVIALGAAYLVVRHVTRVPDEPTFNAPPPPPKFD